MKMKYHRSEKLSGILFILPAFLLLFAFVAYPMLTAFYYSFTNFNIIQPEYQYVGWDNLKQVVMDKAFRDSLFTTFHYAALVIPLQFICSLLLALLIKQKLTGIGFFRTVYFLPVVISITVASVVFKLLYNYDYGLFNIVLTHLGLKPIAFLSDAGNAIYALVLLTVWKSIGFFMMIFLAGLNNISESYYEAAQVDGASKVQQFRRITFPLLKKTSGFILIIITVDAFKMFVQSYVVTGGGPGNATRTVVYMIYETAFKFLNAGYASAAAVIVFAIVVVISIVQLRIMRSDVEY